MKKRQMLLGIFLATLMLSMISLQANHATGDVDPAKPATWSGVSENQELRYLVAEFETPGGDTEGEVALGYNPDEGPTPFWGQNITIAQGDTVYMKINTRNDTWEAQTGDSSIIVEGWVHYFLGWAPVMGTLGPETTNCSVINAGVAQWTSQLLLRSAMLSESHKMTFKPYDAADPTKYDNTFISTLGDKDDNGTIYAGMWSGAPAPPAADVHNATFDLHSCWHMRGDAGGIKNKAYNKIPATWEGNIATWDYGYTMHGYADGGWYGYQLSRAYDYGKGWEGIRPYFTVKTDNTTGIAQEIEFDFSSTSAFKFVDTDGHTMWNLTGNGPDIAHPITTQVSKLKLTLIAATPAFEAVFVFVGISIVALVFIMYRRRK
jgi:hypothetical protein